MIVGCLTIIEEMCDREKKRHKAKGGKGASKGKLESVWEKKGSSFMFLPSYTLEKLLLLKTNWREEKTERRDPFIRGGQGRKVRKTSNVMETGREILIGLQITLETEKSRRIYSSN